MGFLEIAFVVLLFAAILVLFRWYLDRKRPDEPPGGWWGPGPGDGGGDGDF